MAFCLRFRSFEEQWKESRRRKTRLCLTFYILAGTTFSLPRLFRSLKLPLPLKRPVLKFRNGWAEAAVKVSKSMLKKSDDLQTALLNYRNTPPKGHTYSPAQRMMSRRTRTTLPTQGKKTSNDLSQEGFPFIQHRIDIIRNDPLHRTYGSRGLRGPG